MLHTRTIPAERRRALRARLATGRLLPMPGALNPLSARLIQDTGFEAAYLSGAVLAADLGLPDIGLTTSTEIAARAQQTTRATDLPVLIDADTGFGEPLNAARTVQLMEDAGLAGLHLEDQVAPKRCGHLDGKSVVPREQMDQLAEVLREEAGRWQEAAVLGEYCDALERRLAEPGSVVDEPALESARRWLEWAREFVCAISPLNRRPEMPTPREPTPDELKAHMNGWSPYGPERRDRR
ncbi:isocitrate lyase/PEP mutase family protein [Streptomyces sp. A1-5]|uniref:isocitrate lyase/PEP mutase family protein n=1 Tax=Streptomyces sp. A1-5 TaxID=2738410 RepID=UPI001F461AA4|nr:isocitrate lyase/phosphoenolpyruvate mutase family protein [Streptomyces sp. A1-5]